jgi:GTP cyclohydrolase I
VTNHTFHDEKPAKATADRLEAALAEFLYSSPWLLRTIGEEHLLGTPSRVVRMYYELFSGCLVDPQTALNTVFPSASDEMVTIYDIPVTSVCAHHLLPFYGRAHFAYIPNGHIVGLSKIPRLIKNLAKRPQVQENLTCQIADEFMRSQVAPRGVAVCIDAVHTCMTARGVEKPAVTRTTALRGLFMSQDKAAKEFLNGVRRLEL